MSSNAPNPPLPETLAELIRYNRERFGEYVSLIYDPVLQCLGKTA